MNTILAVLALIRDIAVSVKYIAKFIRDIAAKVKFKKALKKAKETGDQRDVEKNLSSNSGEPTEHEYNGLRTGPPKDRRQN